MVFNYRDAVQLTGKMDASNYYRDPRQLIVRDSLRISARNTITGQRARFLLRSSLSTRHALRSMFYKFSSRIGKYTDTWFIKTINNLNIEMEKFCSLLKRDF